MEEIIEREYNNFVSNMEDVYKLGFESYNIETLHYITDHQLRRFVRCSVYLQKIATQDIKYSIIEYKQYKNYHIVQHNTPELISKLIQIQSFIIFILPQIGHLSNISIILIEEVKKRIYELILTFHIKRARNNLETNCFWT